MSSPYIFCLLLVTPSPRTGELLFPLKEVPRQPTPSRATELIAQPRSVPPNTGRSVEEPPQATRQLQRGCVLPASPSGGDAVAHTLLKEQFAVIR